MTTDTLLPPNATAQELAIEQAMRPGADVLAGIELIRTAKESRPDDWLQWLIWEYGLQELLPYFSDPRLLLDEGIQWLRIRGTPDSITQSLGWVDLTATIEEETPTGRHWFEYQFDPGRIPTPAELRKLVDLARLSAPVGTRLSRIFHGYDYRRAIWDQTAWCDGSLYSDQSGVYDPDLDVVLSFGRLVQIVCDDFADDEPLAILQHISDHTSAARYIDRVFWDQGDYSDNSDLIRNYSAVQHSTLQAVYTAGIGRNLRLFDGSWVVDGSVVLNGGLTTEKPQRPAKQITESYDTLMLGWGDVGWSAGRTWNQPADDV